MLTRITFAAIGALAANAFSASLAAGGAMAALSRSNSIESFAEQISDALGVVTSEQLLMAMAAFAGVGVQIVLVAAWRSYLRERDMLLLIIGLVLSTISAALSATTANYFANEHLIERNLLTQSTAPAVAALQDSSDRMRSAAASVRALAAEAEALRREETQSGGTCSDVPTEPGTGPRQRLRDRHADQLASLSRRLNAASGEMFDLAADIMMAEADETEALYRTALALTRSTEMQTLMAEFVALRTDVTDTFYDAQTEETYTCQTPSFAASIAMVEANLTLALEMELLDIRAPDARIADGFSLLLEDLWAWLTGESPDLPTAGRMTLAFIIAVEVIQVAMLITDFRQRRRSGQESDAWVRFNANYNTLSPAQAAQYALILSALDHLVLRSGGHAWLVLGEGSLAPAAREAIFFFKLDSEDAARRGRIRSVPLSRLHPEWVDARGGMLEGTEFVLFRLPPGIDEWRHRAQRDVRHHQARHSQRGGSANAASGRQPE